MNVAKFLRTPFLQNTSKAFLTSERFDICKTNSVKKRKQKVLKF